MADRGYRLLGRAAWKGGRWYLRRRYGRRAAPAKRRAGLAVLGLAAAGIVVKLLLGRAGGAVDGDQE